MSQWGLLAGIEQAIKGGVAAFDSERDRLQKNSQFEQEMDQKKKTLAEQQKLNTQAYLDKTAKTRTAQQQQDLENATKGIIPINDQNQPNPSNKMEQVINVGEGENRKGFLYNPEKSLAGYTAGKTAERMQATREAADKRQEDRLGDVRSRQQDRIDESAHQKVLTKLNSNPNLRARITQIQNLQNGLSILSDADKLPPAQLHEAQQLIRANSGLKGTSGVSERDKTMLESLGWKWENAKTFFGTDLGTVSPNDPILKHVKNLARIEKANAEKQLDKQLEAIAAGNASKYKRNPHLKQDLLDAVEAYKGMTSENPAGLINQTVQNDAAAAAKPAGLIPQSKPKEVIQNGHKYILNEATGQYE